MSIGKLNFFGWYVTSSATYLVDNYHFPRFLRFTWHIDREIQFPWCAWKLRAVQIRYWMDSLSVSIRWQSNVLISHGRVPFIISLLYRKSVYTFHFPTTRTWFSILRQYIATRFISGHWTFAILESTEHLFESILFSPFFYVVIHNGLLNTKYFHVYVFTLLKIASIV